MKHKLITFLITFRIRSRKVLNLQGFESACGGSIPARSTDKNAVIWDLTNKVPDYGIFH